MPKKTQCLICEKTFDDEPLIRDVKKNVWYCKQHKYLINLKEKDPYGKNSWTTRARAKRARRKK